MTDKVSWWRRALRVIGIDTGERGWNAHLRPRFFIIHLCIFGVIVIGMLGMAKYSTSPHFCNSCHIMEPYYNAWATSKHNKVACVDCHYPPADNIGTHLWHKFQASAQVVKYVTRTYSSKPYAEVEDASCLRSGCHSTRLLEGRVFTPKGVKFNHTNHITNPRRGRQLRCASCHSQIVVGKHVEVTYDTCYLCHFKGQGTGRDFKPIGGCLGCHDVPTNEIQLGNMTYNHADYVTKQGVACQDCHLDVVQGTGEAPQDRCFTCHNQPEKLAKYGDIPFIHENHMTKHNVACFHCHQEIRHGKNRSSVMPRLAEQGVTLEDHSPVLTFECSFCHQGKHGGQLEIYSGKVAALGLPEMPSPMYTANVDCIGCHYRESKSASEGEFKGVTFKASENACVKCHGEKFRGIWDETKTELKKTLQAFQEKLDTVRLALKNHSLPETSRRDLQEKLNLIEKQYHFIHASKGEHNIYLSSYALRKGDEVLSDIAEKLQTSVSDLTGLPLLSGSYCATMCHTKVGVKVPPDTVQAFGELEMPHGAHASMMGCVKCHEIGSHKEVPLKKNGREICAECH